MTVTSLKQSISQFESHLLGHWLGPTQPLKPASILGSAHGHVHKPGEKKESNLLSKDKKQGNLTHHVHKKRRRSPQKQGFPGIKKGGQRKSVPLHMVVVG